MSTLRELLEQHEAAWWHFRAIASQYDPLSRETPPDVVAARQAYRQARDAVSQHPLFDAIHAAGDNLVLDTYDAMLEALAADGAPGDSAAAGREE